jgi:hypothetical protein
MNMLARYLRMLTMATLVVLCLSAVPAAADTTATRAAVQPAKFTYLPAGWRAFDRLGSFLDRRGADVSSYAMSWAYKPNPNGWANQMPPNAIAVQIILIRRDPTHPLADLCRTAPRLSGYTTIQRLPLKLPKTTRSSQEGRPTIPQYRVLAHFNKLYNVDVRVEINRTHPTPAMLRVAQRVVSGLRFPRWPLSANC